MRLTKEQREQICTVVQHFDADAEIRLFGSLLDDKARGGDIDLLITPVPTTAFEIHAMENSEIL